MMKELLFVIFNLLLCDEGFVACGYR